ncbi:MAG: D-alanyl-lipoteichoic acid biosynthesis protein DltD [Eubacteriaceae bacterium]|jgi:D-alanine transfer protein|nr:D-alanyl-lipoteichoic acid biosynthesis protein DltD [Eubacteriaceae bacterium]
MKKFQACITAFIISMLIIGCFQYAISNDSLKSADIGTWVNPYKNTSLAGITANLDKNTMPIFGSSEFNHPKKSKYHPRVVFKNQQLTPMLLGTRFSQSMVQAITLAAIEPHMKLRKAVILVSPTWFTGHGAKPQGFALRFSDSEYVAMLQNEDIPYALRAQMAKRTMKLLSTSDSQEMFANLYNKVYLWKNSTAAERALCRIRLQFVSNRDRTDFVTAMKMDGITAGDTKVVSGQTPDWNKMYKSASAGAKKKSGRNIFFMNKNTYMKRFKLKMKKAEKHIPHMKLTSKNEFSDLDVFLKICKASGIKAKVIVLPINGFFYTRFGISANTVSDFETGIHKLAKADGAEITDELNRSFTPYFMQDAVHLSGKGWVKTNETIYKFYREKQPRKNNR